MNVSKNKVYNSSVHQKIKVKNKFSNIDLTKFNKAKLKKKLLKFKMLKQKNLFLNSEGNKYFNRNKKKLDFINYENDPISIKVKKLIGQSKKFNILEKLSGSS